ncbi:MAG: NTP transferase domain-containing protein [Euryarchaeota archaeon]|nr:NTP transferase domain-containing protein [Euryarchaeota archaeon]
MKGVIIAAGAGTRFGSVTENIPKPLIEIDGKPLILWVMDSLIKGGVDDITITVGYHGGLVQKKIGKKYEGVSITYVENRIWEKGNLTSLYAASEEVNERFILSMSDHLFDPEIVRNIVEEKSDTTVLLAVDRKYQQVSDDMKVLVERRMIKDIGKNIIGNFVDIGLFKMHPKIFDYAVKVMNDGKYQLYLAVKEAAENNDAMIIDINRRFWIDVDTPEELNSYYVQNYPKFIKTGKWD